MGNYSSYLQGLRDIKEANIATYVVLAFTLLYLCLPTTNSTSDAYGYACNTEIGGHHALYDLLAAFFFNLLGSKITLATLKILNAFFAAGTLLVLGKLLQSQKAINPWIWVLFAGSCFGFMRFATENETYIIPIFFSLLGIYFLARYELIPKYSQLFFAYLCLTVAIGFHQIHIFWATAATLALWRKKHRIKMEFIVPVCFAILFFFINWIGAAYFHKTLGQWWLGDVQEGLVNLKPGLVNFKMTGINFVRSFYQVHGNIYLFIHDFFIAKMAILISLILCISAFYFTFKYKYKKIPKREYSVVQNAILLAFVLQFGFAWFSEGNAEFMVMLPLLLILYFALNFSVKPLPIVFLAASLLIWNLAIAIIPNHFLNFENTQSLSAKLQSHGNHTFIGYDKILLENYMDFSEPMGKRNHLREKHNDNIKIVKSPADFQNNPLLENYIRNLFKDSTAIYTDCINHPAPMSRKSILNGDLNATFFLQYKTLKVDSFQSYYGRIYIHRVLPK